MSSMQQPSMHPGAGPHPSMGMPPTSMQSMPPAGHPAAASQGPQGPPLAMTGQYMPGVARPQMTSVANP